jgi:hypothetical protein
MKVKSIPTVSIETYVVLEAYPMISNDEDDHCNDKIAAVNPPFDTDIVTTTQKVQSFYRSPFHAAVNVMLP